MCVYLVEYSRNDMFDKFEMLFYLKMFNLGFEL